MMLVGHALHDPAGGPCQPVIVAMGADQVYAHRHVVGPEMGGQRKRRHMQQIPESDKGVIAGAGQIGRRFAGRDRCDQRVITFHQLRQPETALGRQPHGGRAADAMARLRMVTEGLSAKCLKS